MPSSPPRSSPRTSPAHAVRSSPKPQIPSSPRRSQSHSPRGAQSRPQPVRRHTTSTPRSSPRPAPSPRRDSPAPAQGPTSRRRTSSTPVRGSHHVLIPVPIRAKDAECPVYVRAPSGQRIDFVFPEPKKRGIIGRFLDSVEWGGPQENKPYRYRKPSSGSKGAGRPFYKLVP